MKQDVLKRLKTIWLKENKKDSGGLSLMTQVCKYIFNLRSMGTDIPKSH